MRVCTIPWQLEMGISIFSASSDNTSGRPDVSKVSNSMRVRSALRTAVMGRDVLRRAINRRKNTPLVAEPRFCPAGCRSDQILLRAPACQTVNYTSAIGGLTVKFGLLMENSVPRPWTEFADGDVMLKSGEQVKVAEWLRFEC